MGQMMKLAQCLVTTILACLAGLVVPSRTSAIRGGWHGVRRDEHDDGLNDVASMHRKGLDREVDSFSRDIRTVPVPPASATAAETSIPEASRHAIQDEQGGRRPRPSHLDRNEYHESKLHNNGRQQGQHNQGRRSLYHPADGTLRNLVLLLRFSDHTTRTLPSRADISRLYNYDATDPFVEYVDDIVPTGSVRQLYEFNSYHAFTVETTVVDWITLSRPESYYGNGDSGLTKFKEAIIEALTILDNNDGEGGGFNFTHFDLDENGALDGFGVHHSGYGAENGGNDCHGKSDAHRIWSHRGGMDTWTSSQDVGGGDVVSVNRFYVSSALRGTCHSNIVRMGVIAHELGHYLGLPDLYDGTFDGSGIGAYDFMSQSWGFDGSGMYPPNLSAWSKVRLGWARVEVIAHDGAYRLESSATSNTVYKIEAGYPDGEYLLIENRQPTRYDKMMEGGGLAIYHIDEKADAQNNRGYPSPQGDWPENGRHYQVALLAADGRYDLEKGTNLGDSGDLWHSGSVLKELRSGSASYPNTDSYQAGSVAPTGVRIYGFGDSGKLMTFQIAGFGIIAAGAGSPYGIAVSLESIMTPKPSPKPSTLKPVSEAPLSPPPTPKPVTKTPTKVPSRNPSSLPITSIGTSPPSTRQQLCDDLCLRGIAPSECPLTPYDLPDCMQVRVGELCDANGECGSNQSLNNCPPFDVYRRIDCHVASAVTNEVSGTTTGAMTTLKPNSSRPNKAPTQVLTTGSLLPNTNGNIFASSIIPMQELCANLCLDEIASSECPLTPYELQECKAVGVGELCDANGECGSNQALNNCPPFDVYRRIGCHGDSSSALINETTVTSSIVETSGIVTTDTTNCPYYPGWDSGLSYCLNDCRQPDFMISNPSYEFDSIERCCSLHYEGRSSCTTEQKRSNFTSRS